MVKLDENGVEIEWTRGPKKGLKQKVTAADAKALITNGYAKPLDKPPKDKQIKAAPSKK